METPKEGSVVHVELHTNDPPRTKEFFRAVFGWKFDEMPGMNYTLWHAPSPPHGGLQEPAANEPPQTLNYILVNEIGATTRKIERAGGTILVSKTEIPSVGWFAIFREPGGTIQALYQDAHAHPHEPPARAKPARKKSKKTKKSGSRKRK